MAEIPEIGLFDQRSLFGGKGREGLSQLFTFLLQDQRIGLIRFGLGAPGKILRLRPLVFADRIDLAVSSDREDPCGRAGPGRVEKMSLLPERRHHLLGAFLGKSGVSAGAHEKRLYARGEMIEQLGESSLILSVTNTRDTGDPVVIFPFP